VTPDDFEFEPDAKFAAEKMIRKCSLVPESTGHLFARARNDLRALPKASVIS
jgi:hypothetical protein